MTMTNLKKKLQNTYAINIPTSFIDYCNLNNIDLNEWYKWRIHLQKEQQKTWRKLYGGKSC
jgi:hypothetical protein